MHADLPPKHVEVDTMSGEPVDVPALRRTPAERFHAGNQFLQREWFRQIIITALAQAVDPVVDLAERGHE